MCGSRHQRRQLGADVGGLDQELQGGDARLAGDPPANRGSFPLSQLSRVPIWGSALRIPAACEKTTPPPLCIHPPPPPPKALPYPVSPVTTPLCAFPPLLLTPLRSDYPRLVSLVGTLLGCSSNPPPCCQYFSPITPVNIFRFLLEEDPSPFTRSLSPFYSFSSW